ncbi:MAG: hypothetical protein IT289_07415, partial [Oligoflexia bacterium]|nr:hypothetical protein [Oligoflexia bacterium]
MVGISRIGSVYVILIGLVLSGCRPPKASLKDPENPAANSMDFVSGPRAMPPQAPPTSQLPPDQIIIPGQAPSTAPDTKFGSLSRSTIWVHLFPIQKIKGDAYAE